jgi:Carbohydrate esterase, sialic acid-specific acetylesterase
MVFAAFVLASVDSPLSAQLVPGGMRNPVSFGPSVKLKQPMASSVYQRDVNGKAEIPIVVDESVKDAKLTDAFVNGFGANGAQGIKLVDGKLVGVPTGGPHAITCYFDVKGMRVAATVNQVYVGDLWVLAGQSNMEGVGNLIDVTPPHPKVMLLGMDGTWGPAEEPLHWLVDSPDRVHSGNADTRAERSTQVHKSRMK